MPFKRFKVLCCLLVTLISGQTVLVAQEIDFLPAGVIATSYSYSSVNAASIQNGMEKQSILSIQLSNRKLTENSIDGTIAYQTSYHIFKFQYGIDDNLNVGISLPYISKRRDSDLTVSDSSSTTQKQFTEDYKSAESQGLGDISLSLTWRPVYTDGSDFRVGLDLNGNNGATSISDKDNVSLGNGAVDTNLFIRWIIYSSRSNIFVDMELGSVYTFDTTISENGQDYEVNKGNGGNLRLDLSYTDEAWNYGGGLEMVVQGKTSINGQAQDDEYLAYSYKLFVNYGNLNLLEQSPIGLPWLIGASVKNVFSGSNAPAETTIGLKAVVYF